MQLAYFATLVDQSFFLKGMTLRPETLILTSTYSSVQLFYFATVQADVISRAQREIIYQGRASFT
jgi:hypothetical protein